jgi:lipopolysaccharide transport system permease protein
VRHFADPFRMAVSLWRYRSMAWQFIVRDIQSRYMGSSLGLFWSLIQPLMMLTIYTFVFSKVLKAKWNVTFSDSQAEFALTLFAGLLIYNTFSECAARAPSLIISNPNLVKKVVFPLEILSVTIVGVALFNALISLTLLLTASLIFLPGISWTVVLIFPLIIPVICFGLAAGWFLSSLAVFVRDVGLAIPILLQVLIFVSPVFFPIEAAGQYQWILRLNPLSAIITSSRQVLLWGQQPDWIAMLQTTIAAFAAMQLSYIFFMKTKPGFSDVL